MKTLLTTSPEHAAAFIRDGEVVAFPTETVYGLGAALFEPEAVKKIFISKGRPQDNPCIAHVCRKEQIEALTETIPDIAQQLIDAFFPGPLTVILPRHPKVPAIVTAGLPTIGIRMPRHPVAEAFLRACGSPVAAPSANRSGRPSPTSWQAVEEDLGGEIACILKGERSEMGLESTVVDCTQDVPVILRAGVITLERIRRILPSARMVMPGNQAERKSPGTRYRHYAPRAVVYVLTSDVVCDWEGRLAYIGLEAPPSLENLELVFQCQNLEEYAHALYAFFREADHLKIDAILCQEVEDRGLGRALMDRIRRAAAG